jgi:hypothetical protein
MARRPGLLLPYLCKPPIGSCMHTSSGHSLYLLPLTDIVDSTSSPKRSWKDGGRGSGSPLMRAFAGSEPLPIPPLYPSLHIHGRLILGEGRLTSANSRCPVTVKKYYSTVSQHQLKVPETEKEKYYHRLVPNHIGLRPPSVEFLPLEIYSLASGHSPSLPQPTHFPSSLTVTCCSSRATLSRGVGSSLP